MSTQEGVWSPPSRNSPLIRVLVALIPPLGRIPGRVTIGDVLLVGSIRRSLVRGVRTSGLFLLIRSHWRCRSLRSTARNVGLVRCALAPAALVSRSLLVVHGLLRSNVRRLLVLCVRRHPFLAKICSLSLVKG